MPFRDIRTYVSTTFQPPMLKNDVCRTATDKHTKTHTYKHINTHTQTNAQTHKQRHDIGVLL